MRKLLVVVVVIVGGLVAVGLRLFTTQEYVVNATEVEGGHPYHVYAGVGDDPEYWGNTYAVRKYVSEVVDREVYMAYSPDTQDVWVYDIDPLGGGHGYPMPLTKAHIELWQYAQDRQTFAGRDAFNQYLEKKLLTEVVKDGEYYKFISRKYLQE